MARFSCVLLVALFAMTAVYGQWFNDCANTKDCLVIDQMGYTLFEWDPTGYNPASGSRIWRNHFFTLPSPSYNMSGQFPDPHRLTLAAENFLVPAGQNWTVESVSFVANQMSTPIPLYTHMYLYFWNNNRTSQNGEIFDMPTSALDSPLYVTRCDPGVNLAVNATKFFAQGLPRGNAWTCTLPDPLLFDNTAGTSDTVVWFGFAKHPQWDINFLWRYADVSSNTYELVPPPQGRNISTWCGTLADTICAWPWNTYNISELYIFNRWWAFAPYQQIGVTLPATIGFEAELPHIIHGKNNTK